jgi:hypothetical protein
MLIRRYTKINGDSRLTATGDRGYHFGCVYHAAKLMSFSPSICFYLPLSTEQAKLAKVETIKT